MKKSVFLICLFIMSLYIVIVCVMKEINSDGKNDNSNVIIGRGVESFWNKEESTKKQGNFDETENVRDTEYTEHMENTEYTENTESVEPEFKPDDGVTYFNCGSLAIPLPDQYLSQLTVEEKRGDGKPYQYTLRVYETASLQAGLKTNGYPEGFLFEIGAIAPESQDDFWEMQYPGSSFFAKDERYLYVYTEATDVQYYRSGGDMSDWDNWQILNALGPQIKKELLAKLTPYSAQEPEYMGDYDGNIDNDLFGYNSKMVDCPICNGLGICTNCFGGACNNCSGQGRIRCVNCLGLRKCIACGGQGYLYKGVGLMFRQEACTTCRGSGSCGYCGNQGYTCCIICGGTGDCLICNGLGTCNACNGMGYIIETH